MLSRRKLTVLHSALNRTVYPMDEWRSPAPAPSDEVLAYPYYGYLPKDTLQLLKWRIYARERAIDDLDFRYAIMEACEEDVLFFANTLCWIFEPRPLPRKLPLNTWQDQDDCIAWLDQCFGERDVGIEKSRGLGMSWNLCILFYQKWFFLPMCPLGLVSKSVQTLDSKGDPDSLMWKLDFIHAMMPAWWRLDKNGQDIVERKRNTNEHAIINRVNESSIHGYAATDNVMTGGRKVAIGMDEFAKFPRNAQDALDSTQHVTFCRMFISTHKRQQTRFYKLMHKESSTMLRVKSHWLDNPERAKGKYTSYKNKYGPVRVVPLDDHYVYPPDYPFKLDGKIRSPWYDAEERRAGSRNIGEELDGVAVTSSSRLFTAYCLDRAQQTVGIPWNTGRIAFDMAEQKPLWIPENDGKFLVWREVANDGRLSHGGPYAVGCDIANGQDTSESSYSALQVIDKVTGEQVLRYKDSQIDPVKFANQAVAVCRWLCLGHPSDWAYLIFESTGPMGSTFKNEIRRIGYGNVYFSDNDGDRVFAKSRKMGHHNGDGGVAIFEEMQRAILEGELVIRDEATLEEMGQYQFNEDGDLEFSPLERLSRQAKSHGDCAMALAMTWKARQDRKPSTQELEEPLEFNDETVSYRRARPTTQQSPREWMKQLEPMEF